MSTSVETVVYEKLFVLILNTRVILENVWESKFHWNLYLRTTTIILRAKKLVEKQMKTTRLALLKENAMMYLSIAMVSWRKTNLFGLPQRKLGIYSLKGCLEMFLAKVEAILMKRWSA